MFFLHFVHCYVLVTAVPCEPVSVFVTYINNWQRLLPCSSWSIKEVVSVRVPAPFGNSLWGVGGLSREPQRSGFKNAAGGISVCV